VSEPYDDDRDAWEAVPPNSVLTVDARLAVRIESFGPGARPMPVPTPDAVPAVAVADEAGAPSA